MIYDEAFLRGWLSRQLKNIAEEVIKIYTNWGIENPGIEKRPDLRSTENWGPRRLVKNHITNAIIVFQNFCKLFFWQKVECNFSSFPSLLYFLTAFLWVAKLSFIVLLLCIVQVNKNKCFPTYRASQQSDSVFFFFASPHKKGVTLLLQPSIEWHSDYFSQGQKCAWGVIAKGLFKMPPVDKRISDAEHLKTGSLWL